MPTPLTIRAVRCDAASAEHAIAASDRVDVMMSDL